jgi:hypothetical protein
MIANLKYLRPFRLTQGARAFVRSALALTRAEAVAVATPTLDMPSASPDRMVVDGYPLLYVKRPIFVRPLSNAERKTPEAGLRSPDAFTLRCCQILLASNRSNNAHRIAHELGCNPKTARNAIHAFNEKGLPEALRPGSKHPHTVHRAFDPERAEALREMLHQDPRKFGKPSSL